MIVFSFRLFPDGERGDFGRLQLPERATAGEEARFQRGLPRGPRIRRRALRLSRPPERARSSPPRPRGGPKTWECSDPKPHQAKTSRCLSDNERLLATRSRHCRHPEDRGNRRHSGPDESVVRAPCAPCPPALARSLNRPRRTWLERFGPSAWIIALVRLYQRSISPWLPPSCRYRPTCSAYAIDAIRRRGLLIGVVKGALRVLRCNPLFRGGWDPVDPTDPDPFEG